MIYSRNLLVVCSAIFSILFAVGCSSGGGSDGTASEGRTTITAPVADAGVDQAVATGSLVTLDGSASVSLTGGSLTYAWAFRLIPLGSAASLSNSADAMPTFTADMDGAYVLSLVVNDGTLDSLAAFMFITATTPNNVPAADAGPDQNVRKGILVTLDGLGSSDADSDPLTYSWAFVSVPAGSGATLSNPTLVNPAFVVDVEGSYVVRLVVDDGISLSPQDTITVTATNTVPVANAGTDRSVNTGTVVTLDGSGSGDANGDPLTYLWSFVSVPGGSGATFSSPTSAHPSFTVDVDGAFIISLVVSDGTATSNPDAVTITGFNLAPFSNAGLDQQLVTGSTVILDGSGSGDLNGDALTYTWSFILVPPGSTATLSNASTVSPSFTTDLDGRYAVNLVVSDGKITSFGDQVIVTANRSIDRLSFLVTDAEFNKWTDEIVMVSTSGNQLHIYDPSTQVDRTVNLPLTPTCVSVGPSGLFAAVGHDGWISYVDLTAGALVKTMAVSTDVFDIVLAGNGFVYAFPRRDQWETIRCIEIATEVETLSGGFSIRAGTRAKLHPDGTSIYGANNGLSPSDIEKYDISGGTAAYLYDSPYHGDFAMCGDLWISEDGLRLFTRCGNTFRTSDLRSEDMIYTGSLGNLLRVQHLDHSTLANQVAALRMEKDTELQLYDATFLALLDFIPLPNFLVSDNVFPGHGKFVFYSGDGSQIFTILQADASSGLLFGFGIVTY